MKKSTKLPTILGIVILSLGLVAGIFLINSRQIFRLGAQEDSTPQNVRISNVTNKSVTVTWTTTIESLGFIQWGESKSNLGNITQETGTAKDFIHSANITGLNPGTDIYFEINSNSKVYDNNGVKWQTRTNSSEASSNSPLIASGVVLKADTINPASAIVYLSINGLILSEVTSQEGSWIIPISNYINSVSDTTVIEISVNGGPGGSSQAVIYPKAIKSVPTIILGKTYDFRTLESNTDGSLPESSVSVPESVEKSSRFEVTKPETTDTTTVSLDSINDGEIITTTDPEFFGKGPAGATVEVVVESDPQTGTVTANSSGSWNWSPPENLEPGEHTVTVKWTDASGIIRTIQRSFIVSASEGPAFESTPSATPVNISPTSTPVSVSTQSPEGTIQPTPETGSLTPTIGLFIMGLGILLSSIYVWNKEYAQ